MFERLNNKGGHVFFDYIDGNEYRIDMLNDFNASKLDRLLLSGSEVLIDIDADHCIITSIDEFVEEFTCVICHVSYAGKSLKDCHEVHSNGDLTRGCKHGVQYQEVLDVGGLPSYTVTVVDGIDGDVVGMFLDTSYAFVRVSGSRTEIIDTSSAAGFVSEMGLNEYEEYKNMEHTAIIEDYACRELDCPRW